MNEDFWKDAEVISVYTRAQAIQDGELVDVTEQASADKGFIGGYTIPVALTRTVWGQIENIPQTPSCRCQDVRGRLHDVLWMSSLAGRAMLRQRRQEGCFKVIMPITGSRKRYQVYKLHLGPGDDGEPVATIMLPHED